MTSLAPSHARTPKQIAEVNGLIDANHETPVPAKLYLDVSTRSDFLSSLFSLSAKACMLKKNHIITKLAFTDVV